MEQQGRPNLTPKAETNLHRLGPKTALETETSWADPWNATRPARQIVMGRLITDEINADPSEVARLRKARQEARAGKRYPRRGETS